MRTEKRTTFLSWMVGLALASAFIMTGAGTTRAAEPLPKALEAYGGSFVVRPSFMDITPTDGLALLGAGRSLAHAGPVKWSSWTTSSGRGKGALFFDTCEPSCAGGRQIRYPASIRVSRPRDGRFTLLTIYSSYRHATQVYKMIEKPGFGGEFVYVSG